MIESSTETLWVGLDVHQNSITAAIALPQTEQAGHAKGLL